MTTDLEKERDALLELAYRIEESDGKPIGIHRDAAKAIRATLAATDPLQEQPSDHDIALIWDQSTDEVDVPGLRIQGDLLPLILAHSRALLSRYGAAPQDARNRWPSNWADQLKGEYEQGLKDGTIARAPQAGEDAEPVAWLKDDGSDAWTREKKNTALHHSGMPGKRLAARYSIPLQPSQDEQQSRDAIELLGPDHKGMRVDYSGLLMGAANSLILGRKETGLAEMLRQLQGHLAELGLRWYEGDTAVVDELLQLYCIGKEAREAVKAAIPTTQHAQVEKDAEREILEGPAYGIIDPDYARIFTQARIIAWQYGYACVMHGSFTRDLDLLMVPWEDHARANHEQILKLIAEACGLRFADGEQDVLKAKVDLTDKPHGRKACGLYFPQWGDRRWVDVSFMPCAAIAAAKEEGK